MFFFRVSRESRDIPKKYTITTMHILHQALRTLMDTLHFARYMLCTVRTVPYVWHITHGTLRTLHTLTPAYCKLNSAPCALHILHAAQCLSTYFLCCYF